LTGEFNAPPDRPRAALIASQVQALYCLEMRKIRSSRLHSTPSAAALHVIDACARDLAPQSAGLSAWHDDYLANHRVRIAHDLDIINREIPKSKSIMEFGSIPLVLTAALKSCGFRVTGCDIRPERYASTIEAMGLTIVECNIETQPLPFADESFDAAVFNELFEHLRINPVFTLTEVLRIMKPNGILTLSTPNLRSLDGIRNFLLRDRAFSCASNIYLEYQKLQTIGHMGHVREYTRTEVVEFLQTIGFAVTAIIYRGEYDNVLKRALISLIPSLSPFVTYIARKPALP
jgi:SAM-dependent methyltransferase